MNAITTIRRAPEPEGLRPIKSLMPSIVGDIFAQATSFGPRYTVQDGMIVTLSTGRRQTVEAARRALGHYLEDALTVPHPDLVDIDLIHVVHLVHAIREAEGRGPTPPAANAMAVPQEIAA